MAAPSGAGGIWALTIRAEGLVPPCPLKALPPGHPPAHPRAALTPPPPPQTRPAPARACTPPPDTSPRISFPILSPDAVTQVAAVPPRLPQWPPCAPLPRRPPRSTHKGADRTSFWGHKPLGAHLLKNLTGPSGRSWSKRHRSLGSQSPRLATCRPAAPRTWLREPPPYRCFCPSNPSLPPPPQGRLPRSPTHWLP